jgi:uncharacterized membrane protein YjjB (DUF3815 family)
MIVAAAVGVVAGLIHFGSSVSDRVNLQKSFIAGLCGGLCALLLSRLLAPVDLGRAIFGGVSLLVPAMVITIATHELANDALESGTVRMAYGLLRLLMLAFGLGAALYFGPKIGLPVSTYAAKSLPYSVVLVALLAGGLALVICLQARWADAPWVIGSALLAYTLHRLTDLAFPGHGSPFLAAFALGVVAYLYGRRPGRVAATILVPGFLQLAPGFLATENVLAAIVNAPGHRDPTAQIVIVSLQLVTGILTASALFHRPHLVRIEAEQPPHKARVRKPTVTV